MPGSKTAWTDAMRDQLRTAWFDKDLSLRQVSERMGLSEDICSNEASRLHFPTRAQLRGTTYLYQRLDKPQPPRRYLAGDRTIPLLPSERDDAA